MTKNTNKPKDQDQDSEKSALRRFAPDVFAFATGLATAYFLKWQTKDLVWSLWLCSLVLGYLTLLSAVAAGAYIGIHALRHEDCKPEHRLPAILIGTGGGLFFLCFFSVHFCGFHAGHSVFLRHFFPLDGLPEDGFGRAFMNPPLLWYYVFRYLMKPYGLFLIPTIISERNNVFRPLIMAVKAVRAGEIKGDIMAPLKKGKIADAQRDPLHDIMARPYLNVVRMHMLIFFFAFCHFTKLDGFPVYAAVYTVYFFPWNDVKALIRKNKSAASR